MAEKERQEEHQGKAKAAAVDEAEEVRQIVLDVGTQRKKDLRQLEEGHGALADEVNAAIELMKAQAAEGAPAREIIPVVFLVKRRSPRSRRGLLGSLLDV